jgi:large repetitive protein
MTAWRLALLVLHSLWVVGCQPSSPEGASALSAVSVRGREDELLVGFLYGARAHHTATLLPSGEVLIIGGEHVFMPNNVAESLHLTAVVDQFVTFMEHHRSQHTATLLPSGKVLAVGGRQALGETLPLVTAELYDPGTRTWSMTGGMAYPRYLHTATLLGSGEVLIVGGGNLATSAVYPAELYNPLTGTWRVTGTGASIRSMHTATLLPSGQVLAVGGDTGGSAELYEPSTGIWRVTAAMSRARYLHTATLLPSGEVLVVGGDAQGSAELYDPVTESWRLVASLTQARMGHTATLLPSGKVLVTGGGKKDQSFSALKSAERYDPGLGTWSQMVALAADRKFHTATLLPSGEVLVTGGYTGEVPVLKGIKAHDSIEFYKMAPVVREQTLFTAEDTPLPLTLGTMEAVGQAVTFAVVTPPAHGSISGTPPQLAYLPHADYVGPDVLTYKAVDGVVESAPAAVSLSVQPVNDAPAASSFSVTTPQGTHVSTPLKAMDVDGDALTYIVLRAPTRGKLIGQAPDLIYIPQQSGYGSDSFTYQASDGLLDSEVATVSITVTPGRDGCNAMPGSSAAQQGLALVLIFLLKRRRTSSIHTVPQAAASAPDAVWHPPQPGC